MAFIVFLRGVSDTGFYYFFAAFLAGLFGARPRAVALGLLLQCLALTAGYLLRGRRARFAPLAVPVLYLLLASQGMAERLAQTPTLLYMISLLRSETYEPTWDHEAELFSKFWKIVVIFLFLWISFSGLFEGIRPLLQEAALPGALVTLTSLILLMRALRHDREVYTKGKRQVIDLAIFALLLAMAALLGSRPVLEGLWTLTKLTFRYAVYPLLQIAAWLAGIVIRLVGWVLSKIFRDLGPIEMPDLSTDQAGNNENVLPDAVPEAAEGSPILRAMLIVAGAALLVFAAWKLLRMLYLRGPELADNGEKAIERVQIPEDESPRERRRPRTPAERVRREYRGFLRLCRQRGMRLTARDTSLSVQAKSHELSAPEESRELRSLYIAARYGGRADASDADAAEQILRRLRRAWRDGEAPEGTEERKPHSLR